MAKQVTAHLTNDRCACCAPSPNRAPWAEADALDLAVFYRRDDWGRLQLTELGRRKGYSL